MLYVQGSVLSPPNTVLFSSPLLMLDNHLTLEQYSAEEGGSDIRATEIINN